MKQILFFILFSLNCVLGFSQHFNSNDIFTRINYPLRPSNQYSFKASRTIQHHPDNEWKYVDISDSCCVLKHIDGKQYFAGKVKKKYSGSEGKVFTSIVRDGTGILKTISNEGIKYVSGTWKRDFLSGDSLVKDNDGNVFFCKWKFGKMVQDSQREASEDERARLEENIDTFESQIRISGLWTRD